MHRFELKLSMLNVCIYLAIQFGIAFSGELGQCIRSNSIPEKELVIARSGEDISWSDEYHDIRLVYDKGRIGPPWWRSRAIDLHDVGEHVHTFLHHIESCYDALADWTFFSLGRWHDQGFPGIQPSDYMSQEAESKRAFLPITSELDGVDRYRARSGYQENLEGILGRLHGGLEPWKQRNRHLFQHFADWDRRHAFWSGRGDYDLASTNGRHLAQGDDGWVHLQNGVPWLAKGVANQERDLNMFWHDYVCPNDPPSSHRPRRLMLTGGLFSGLSRKAIHRRPREFYTKLRILVESMGKKARHIEGLIFTFWRYIFLEGDACQEPPNDGYFDDIDLQSGSGTSLHAEM